MNEEEKITPDVNSPAGRNELLKKQAMANTVINGVRVPDLTTPERNALTDINVPDKEGLSEADKALLKKQTMAGIEGNPPLNEAEIKRIAEINSRTPTRL